MRIVRLEIFGFKSFVDRFVLNLDKNMVGIVGPNGCGKSNIVDALRWVLGETNARQLRGGVLEDLIFNGSDARRALGMCEVAITLRNERAEGLQVLTASIEQDVSAEEVADNAEDLVSENVEVTVSDDNSPEATLKVLKEVGESKTANSLADIPGLFDATEVQLTRRLYRSGESEYFINRVPCRLSDMVEFYRLIGLGARGMSIVQQGQIGQIVTKKPVERRELLEEAAGISGFRARIEVAQRKLEKTGQNMLRLSDVITEVEKQVRSLKRQASRAEQRAELKESLKRAELELYAVKVSRLVLGVKDAENTLSSLDAEIEQYQNEILGTDSECEKIRADLHQKEVEVVALRSRRDVLSERINGEKAKENALRLELTRLEGQLDAAHDRIDKINRRRQQIAEDIAARRLRIEETNSFIEVKRQEQAQVELDLNNILDRNNGGAEGESPEEGARRNEIQALQGEVEELSSAADELKQLEQDMQQKRKALRDSQGEIHNKQLRHARIESEITALNSQLEEMAEAVAKQAQGVKGNQEITLEGAQVFVAGITVSEQLQVAINAVLGEQGNFLVYHSASLLAENYTAQNRSSGKDQARFGVIGRDWTGAQEISRDGNQFGEHVSCKWLLDEVQVAPGFEGVADALLGNVVLVQELQDGVRLQEERRNQGLTPIIAVTSRGEVVTHWGWYTTDGKGVALSFTRRINERRDEAEKFAVEIAQLAGTIEQIERELQGFDEKIKDARVRRERFVDAQKRINALLNIMRDEDRRVQQERMNDERRVQQEMRRVSNELNSLCSKVEFEAKRITELESELVDIDGEESGLRERIESLDAEKNESSAKLDIFAAVHEDSNSEVSQLYSEFNRLQEEISDRDNERDWLVGELSRVSQRVEEIRRKNDALVRQQNNLKLVGERDNLEVSMLAADIERFYPGEGTVPDIDRAGDLLSGISEIEKYVSDRQEESRVFRSRIEREGDVDPASIEMYQTEKTRLDDLTRQQKDLESARKTLESTIKQLKEVSKERFIETFTFVSKKFEELVPLLFGGGAGFLQLLNPEDPLTSGVEITVRPPGKKLKSMELMSGGEKALSATSLLFAVFLFKPSPICVLDEVDAPLDDANLDRFLAMVKTIAKDTQFLVITHNKQTMAAVDRLVGITMQERGVSTALAVSFEDVEGQLEQSAVNF